MRLSLLTQEQFNLAIASFKAMRREEELQRLGEARGNNLIESLLACVERERRAMTEPLRVERDRSAQIGVDNVARLQRVFEA